MNKEKKKFVKNIGIAMKQIKDGKGLTEKEVFVEVSEKTKQKLIDAYKQHKEGKGHSFDETFGHPYSTPLKNKKKNR